LAFWLRAMSLLAATGLLWAAAAPAVELRQR
jgi:hypothetical protein